MEPHVFCGPEFLLAIPEERLTDVLVHSSAAEGASATFDGPIAADVLSEFQTDMFNVLTPHLRRRLHHGYAQAAPGLPQSEGTSTAHEDAIARLDRQQRHKRMTAPSLVLPPHQGSVPPPPTALRFLEPLLRYPKVFAPRLTRHETEKAADEAPTPSPEPEGEAKAKEEEENTIAVAAGTDAPNVEPLPQLLKRTPTLVATATAEEELLLNSVRVLTSQRPQSTTGPQSSTAALSAALAAAATPSSSSPEAPARPAVHFFLLNVCDSRVAAELYMLCLANFHISLAYGAKLYATFARTAKAAPTVLEEVLSKRDVLRSHANMDSDLHEVLDTRLTEAFVEGVLETHARSRGDGSGSTGLLTSEARHAQHVEAVVQYCEEKVQYAGALDNDGEASPFLLAMGLALKLELTPQDLLRHFLPHPRRIVRAVALFLARYLFPPEDLAPFFVSAVGDAVVIACTEDQSLTTSLQDLATQLLEKDEVNEAWLPGAAPWRRYWLPRVIAPMQVDMQRYVMEQKQDRERRLAEATGAAGHAATDASAQASAAAHAGTTESASELNLPGSGRGVSALGFRSLTDLVQFAKQKERGVAYETLKRRLGQFRAGGGGGDIGDAQGTARKRRRDGEATADGDDWELVLQEQEDNDDFLINVEVDGRDDEGDLGGFHQSTQGTSAPNGLVGGGDAATMQSHLGREGGGGRRGDGAQSTAQRQKERLTARQTAMKEGYALTLSLLGRTQPFQRDERYLEF